MNIIHVSTQDTWGGGEKQIWYLMHELRKKGVEQSLVCPVNSVLAKKIKADGFPLFEWEKSAFTAWNWGQSLSLLTSSDSIIHTHDGKAHDCAFIHALFHSQTPIFVHRRLVKTSHSLFQRWKFNHSSIKKIICVSSAVKKNLEALVKDKNKLITIPSGIELPLIEKKDHLPVTPSSVEGSHTDKEKNYTKASLNLNTNTNTNTNTKLILNIGSLLPQKEQKFFLQIAKSFFETYPEKKKFVTFAILGEGPLRKDLQSYISENNLQDNCVLLGFSNQVQDILKASDLLINTSLDEALGNVIMEAFLAGVPVAARDSGGIPDLVEHEKTGFLLEKSDINSFVITCKNALEDSESIKKIKAQALKKLENFDIVKTTDSLYRLYLATQAP